MSYVNPEDVRNDLNLAIERQDYEAGGESLCDILQSVAPPSCDYWYEAACELHRREKFYEALDCWREAEKYIAQLDDGVGFWYEDMVRTLINATDQTEDPYFKQQALAACIRACEIEEGEDIWNARLNLEIQLQFDADKLLARIEYMLDKGYDIENARGYLFGAGWLENINNYDKLAQCLLERDNISEALRIWSKAVKGDRSGNKQVTCNAIYWLVRHADVKGYDLNEYLPDNFDRMSD